MSKSCHIRLIAKFTITILEKILEIDYQTQLDGESFYHIYVNSDSLIPPSIEKSYRKL